MVLIVGLDLMNDYYALEQIILKWSSQDRLEVNGTPKSFCLLVEEIC